SATGPGKLRERCVSDASGAQEPDLLVREEEGLLRCTLNRPAKLNAMTQQMMDLFRAALVRFRDTDSLKVLLIDAKGRYFCAGADLKGGNSPKHLTARGIRENLRRGVYVVQANYDEMDQIE